MIIVSRESSATADGEKLCGCGCGKPRDRQGQSYRKECHTEYMRLWRAGQVGAGMIEMRLTEDEWAMVKLSRQQQPETAGRHRARP